MSTRQLSARLAKLEAGGVPPEAIAAAFHAFEDDGALPESPRIARQVDMLVCTLAAIERMWEPAA